MTPEEIARLRQIIADEWVLVPPTMTDEQFMAYGLIFQKTINALSVDRKTKGVIGVYRLTTKFKARLRYGAMVKTGCDAATLPAALDEIERQRVEIERLTANQCCIGEALVIEDGKTIGCHPENQLRQMEGHTDELGIEIQSLRARIAEMEAECRWRPIATAPKDGTEILCFYSGGLTHSLLSYFDGWVGEDGFDYVSTPTHWMPLTYPSNEPTT